MLVGAGGAVREAINAARNTERLGVTGLMIHHPVGARVHPTGTLHYYRQFAESVNIGVVEYVRDRLITRPPRVNSGYARDEIDALLDGWELIQV